MKQLNEYIDEHVLQQSKSNLDNLEVVDKALASYKEKRPEELRGFKEHVQKVVALRDTFKPAGNVTLNINVIAQAIQQDMQAESGTWIDAQVAEFEQIDAQMESLKLQIETENKLYNEQLRQGNSLDNATFESLEAKRKILAGYSDRIFDICSMYGISTSDVDMDASMFTAEELSKLYDDYIKYIEKDVTGRNIITTIRSKISSPYVQGSILLIFLLLCFTQILDILSFVFFGLLISNQLKNAKRAKYYSILLGITFNVKPEELGYISLDTSQLLPEELTDDMMDNDERFSQFEAMYDAVENKYTSLDPKNVQSQLMNEFEMRRPEIEKLIRTENDKFKTRHTDILSGIEEEIAFLNKRYEELKSQFKTLGEKFSKHLYFSDEFILGLHDDCIEETVNIGLRNIIIRPCRDENLLNKFIQVLYVNAIANVLPGSLTVYVYDPNGFGRALTPFYSQELMKNLIFENNQLGNILDLLMRETQNNFKDMGSLTIQEFNADCEKTGVTAKPYNLLIIMSQPKTVEEDEKLRSFLEYSATGGTIIWVVSNVLQVEDTMVFRAPFDGVEHPFSEFVNDEWCKKVRKNHLDAIKDAKPKGLLWQDFINHVIPREKTWSGKADKFIDFYPGYENGDPSLYTAYTLGNEGNVHAIGVGTSGAGKSVFLNHIVGTMCRLYDPSQLELWLCDFKGVEFKAYMKTPRTKAARLCKPVKATQGYAPKKDEKTQEVLGYYSYKPDTKEYVFSSTPTSDCSELHVFMQDLKEAKDKNGNTTGFFPKKDKKGNEIPPRPKADTGFADNMESYCLPHIAACLCTSDGDFATSLFKAYRDKADTRYEDMKILGVKNMPGWNSRVKTLIGSPKPPGIVEAHRKETNFNPTWTEDDIWPRVLFICDEFQVIFQKADANNVEKIKADITQIAKVARACGMHIFFTSQSMKGTISGDVLANFSLRFALRCEPEVSQDILGSTRAAEIKEKNGFLIVKSLEMKTPEEQKRYKTPFLCDDENSGVDTTSELFDNIRFLYNLAKERGFKERDVIAYEESTKHPIQQLIDTYHDEQTRKALVAAHATSGVFFLGMRMAYSANKAPDNIILGRQNNTNIMSVFSDYKDLGMFFNTIVTNIQCNDNPGTILINTQIDDLAEMVDAEKYITRDVDKKYLSPKTTTTEMIEWVQKVSERRRESGKVDSPIWLILLGWDKGKGIGVDRDASLGSKLGILLQTVGELNIHLIFINSSLGQINAGTIDACKYRICGKCSIDESQMILGNRQASKSYEMATGWLFSNVGGKITRDKLYISEVKDIASSEISIT